MPGSTDMANVSWVHLTIHPALAICDEGVAGRSIAFRDAAISARADETTLLAATLVAQTALDLYLDPHSLTPPGRRSAPVGARPGCTIAPARPAGRRIANRRRPG